MRSRRYQLRQTATYIMSMHLIDKKSELMLMRRSTASV